ncbi:peptidoglycan bridge formation glycyltransferase FemA/FemB family protein [Candidatus Saccharibacteria bacterium]|nr:peptidoglycan bridge formation glycyltransferase FemA/FemB family protein [Candidatus Saccharibacteria bacterium]
MNSWDNTIISLGGGVLQSQAWADFQESIGRGLVRQSDKGWAWQGFIRNSKGLRYLFLPYGPVVQANSDEALRSLIFSGEEQGCDFVRCEPIGRISRQAMLTVGARQISEVEPQHTFVLDLTQDETDLRHGLQSGHRNRINTGAKRGITVEAVANLAPIDDFLRLMSDTARHAHIINYPDSYYVRMAEVLIGAGQAVFYVSRVAGQVASVSLVYDFDTTRYYAFTGNDQQLNREHKVAVSAVWQMIVDAKQKGLTKFDLWGAAPDESPDHKWAGITAFKKGFGGERVATIGTWDIPIKHTKYRAYSLYRKLRG